MTNPANVVELARQLVCLPSVNPMGRSLDVEIATEGRVTDWLQEFFSSFSDRWRRYTVREDSLTGGPASKHDPNAASTGIVKRENIVARFDGYPSVADGGRLVMLEAHQDTVPIDGMTIEPFAGELCEGRLYGRGACDIKGGLACLLSAAQKLRQTSATNWPTVIVACTVNEEFGFCGAKHLARLISQGGDEIIPRVPDAIIVTEPTELHVVSSHKGMVRWACESRGVAAHSSNPGLGNNAIYRMAAVIQAIERFAKELAARKQQGGLGLPTISVGTIVGGISVNTVPDKCKIEIDRRCLPDEDHQAARQEVIDYVADKCGDIDIHHGEPTITSPGLAAVDNRQLAESLLAAANETCPGRRIEGVPYGTDAAFLSATGVPTVVFGPGSIDQAHTCDEWVELNQLELAEAALLRFLQSPHLTMTQSGK